MAPCSRSGSARSRRSASRLNRTFLNTVELTVRAVVEGSRDHVYQAALLDPNTAATLTTDADRQHG